jgi:hypothetical protein
MDFSFGIITNETSCDLLDIIIDSIELQYIPNYEIIIIGNVNIKRKNTIVIPFDESIYPCWITKKKNIITPHAKYENIVYMHDYVKLVDDWYNGFLLYGHNFDIISYKILYMYYRRFRDLVLNRNFLEGKKLLNGQRTHVIINGLDEWIQSTDNILLYKPNGNEILLDYTIDLKLFQPYIYISGTYWVAKKHVMTEFPLNENLLHGHSEDVDWTQMVREKYIFKFNVNSTCRLLRHKEMSNPVLFTYSPVQQFNII